MISGREAVFDASPRHVDRIGLSRRWLDSGTPERPNGVPRSRGSCFLRERRTADPRGQLLLCHGETMQGRFDLRSRESALAGGSRGSDIIPGDADGSRLFRRIAGLEQPTMPAQGAPLTASQISAIKQWIDEGAKWDSPLRSADAGASTPALAALESRSITAEERNYWAFKLPAQVPLPAVDSANRTNPIDRFL